VPTNAERAATLVRVLRASVAADSSCVAKHFVADLQGWTPCASVSSAVELAVEIEDRDEAFSDVELTVAPLDVGGEHAAAEWVVTFTHSGPLELDDVVIAPTYVRVHVHGITVAEFCDDRIQSFREYWDEGELVEQLGLRTEP
jgi:hypothetical protein